jgi:nitroreductase
MTDSDRRAEERSDERQTAADGGVAGEAVSPLTELTPEVAENRDPDHDVAPLLVNRWSPRAMSGEAVADADLDALFEAARWAPSSYNNQHWRFLVAERDDGAWETFFGFLNDANQAWAEPAGALVVLVSKTTFDHNGERARTHSFDTGAAWQNLALEAARRGLVAHAIQGFDYEAAAAELSVPDEFEVEAMIAVGERGDPDDLPEDFREGEAPNGRKPLDEIVVRGGFGD